jgi:hypothetical protein
VRAKLVAAIDALADDPRPVGCKKLAGSANRYRIRAAQLAPVCTSRRPSVMIWSDQDSSVTIAAESGQVRVEEVHTLRQTTSRAACRLRSNRNLSVI